MNLQPAGLRILQRMKCNGRSELALDCGLRGKAASINQPTPAFCLNVARMSRADPNQLIDQYEQDVDEIIAACRGDLRGAVRALMLINEQLEQALQRLSAALIEKVEEERPHGLLH